MLKDRNIPLTDTLRLTRFLASVLPIDCSGGFPRVIIISVVFHSPVDVNGNRQFGCIVSGFDPLVIMLVLKSFVLVVVSEMRKFEKL